MKKCLSIGIHCDHCDSACNCNASYNCPFASDDNLVMKVTTLRIGEANGNQ